MAADAGWIKLWRKARENPYLQDVVQRAVFFTLLLDAEPDPTERRIKRAVVPLGRGQSLITERELATELKLGRQQIRRAIANLKKGGLINPTTNPQTNPETNPGWTLVTICNFERYQRFQPTANPETNPETNHDILREEGKNLGKSHLRIVGDNSLPSENESNNSPPCGDGHTLRHVYKFDEWWTHWTIPGTKTGKAAAKRKYESTIKSEAAAHGELCDGVDRYMNACRRDRRELRYIKGPEVWLNKGCWSDELVADGHPRPSMAHDPVSGLPPLP